jgi:hypothetical protein
MRQYAPLAALILAAASGIAACGGDGGAGSPAPGSSASMLPQGGDHVDLAPADFTTAIDNPYLPMTPATAASTA